MVQANSKISKDSRHQSGAKAPVVLSAKGEKAKAKLKKAALEVMSEVGYHKMRISDVTKQAGVAAGLFHHYFPDLKSLTNEVMEDFVAKSLNVESIEKSVGKGDWYGRIFAHNRLVVVSYAERPGIMRCMLQLADEDKEFAQLLRNNFVKQLRWLVDAMPKLYPQSTFSKHQLLMMVYALGGTGETILRDYYINCEPALTENEVTVDEMTELLTVIFYRGLFLQNPPAEKLRYIANLDKFVKQF
jgi:AcrR family transcriptional regulator